MLLLFLQFVSPAQVRPPRKPAAPRSSIQLQTPSAGQVVSGIMKLSVAGNFSNVARVYYKLGHYIFASSSQSPFGVSWNSALAADGNSQIETVSYDIFGNVLSDTYTPVVFSNYGDKAEVLAPGFPAAMSGLTTVNLHAYDSLHYPAYWTSAIDGEVLPVIFTDQSTKNDNTQAQTIDTTIYSNGLHEFYFAFHSGDYNNPKPAAGNENYRGMVMQLVNTQNGRTFMEVMAGYLHVYTSVGGNLSLGCSRVYTNGDHDACLAPQWAPRSHRSLSRYDRRDDRPENGLHRCDPYGGRQDHADSCVGTERSRAAAFHHERRHVDNVHGRPAPTFVIAPYTLAPNYVSADPNLLSEAQRAGINTLTTGIYPIRSTDLDVCVVAIRLQWDDFAEPAMGGGERVPVWVPATTSRATRARKLSAP